MCMCIALYRAGPVTSWRTYESRLWAYKRWEAAALVFSAACVTGDLYCIEAAEGLADSGHTIKAS